MSQAVLAECMRVNRYRVNDLILGRRSMSAEMALRLGKVFNMSPEFWCNLQIAYDLAIAKTKHEKDILDIVPL
jgi:addiction module HigA family antidote